VRILLDTSVLVAAMVESHPAHTRALPWLQRVKGETDTGLVAAHSLAELYAILTTLPVQPRILPTVAQQLIKYNVLDVFEVVLHTASKANVDQVVTLNEKDFRRVYPNLADRIVSP